MIFSYKEYKKFLQVLKTKGPIKTFKELDNTKSFLLRHDIELHINPAYQLAIIENEYSIRSTFFFLTTSETYNVLSVKNRSLIKKIKDLGHEIGLHFDASVYGNISKKDLQKKADKEAKILELIIDDKIRSISLHNPSEYNKYPMFRGYINAYDPKIFNDNFYISDSRMDFQGKNIFKFIENIKKGTVQILLHPFHYSKKGEGYPTIFWKYFHEHIKDVHNLFTTNSTYRRQLKKGLIKHIGKKLSA